MTRRTIRTNSDLDNNKEVFSRAINDLLFPLFPGTTFCDPKWINKNKKSTKLVALVRGRTHLKLAFPGNVAIRCEISRAQPFTDHEKNIVKCFVSSFKDFYKKFDTPLKNDYQSTFMLKVVTESIAPSGNNFLLRLISILSEWAQQTYEGQRISFSAGIELSNKDEEDGQLQLEDIEEEDFLKVLSNGHDTVLVFNSNGNFIEHKTLDSIPTQNDAFAPVRYLPIAQWCAEPDRVAVILNRNGEIIIFKDGELMFAKRRGKWRFFSHNSVVSQFTKDALSKKSSIHFRRGVYLTALDISFARTGGCLGVISRSESTKMKKSKIVTESDLFNDPGQSRKTKLLKALVSSRKFQDLDRLLRLELVSIDGSTVLDHQGNILALGAILSIPGGSTGGGRHAATKAIAKYGLGIKISNDGYIKVMGKNDMDIAEFG